MGSSLPAHELVQNNIKHLSIVLYTVYHGGSQEQYVFIYSTIQRNPLFCNSLPSHTHSA